VAAGSPACVTATILDGRRGRPAGRRLTHHAIAVRSLERCEPVLRGDAFEHLAVSIPSASRRLTRWRETRAIHLLVSRALWVISSAIPWARVSNRLSGATSATPPPLQCLLGGEGARSDTYEPSTPGVHLVRLFIPTTAVPGPGATDGA
jgi:hypothetical protein